MNSAAGEEDRKKRAACCAIALHLGVHQETHGITMIFGRTRVDGRGRFRSRGDSYQREGALTFGMLAARREHGARTIFRRKTRTAHCHGTLAFAWRAGMPLRRIGARRPAAAISTHLRLSRLLRIALGICCAGAQPPYRIIRLRYLAYLAASCAHSDAVKKAADRAGENASAGFFHQDAPRNSIALRRDCRISFPLLPGRSVITFARHGARRSLRRGDKHLARSLPFSRREEHYHRHRRRASMHRKRVAASPLPAACSRKSRRYRSSARRYRRRCSSTGAGGIRRAAAARALAGNAIAPHQGRS